MDGNATAGDSMPEIALHQVSADRQAGMEGWSIGWRITNRGAQPLSVVAARMPHGQFKSEELRFEPPLELPPDGRAEFQIAVRCNEPSGLVTENAFVILLVIWAGESWRIFARMRVKVDGGGIPGATAESITTQKVGFSGITS